ncbi:MAG: hypothetical protein R2991_03050 [Thermoanaerobaculia bacterium]
MIPTLRPLALGFSLLLLTLASCGPQADNEEPAGRQGSIPEPGPAHPPSAAAPRWSTDDVVAVDDAAAQIAGAVVALPPDLRNGATVLGYDAEGTLVPLRAGANGLVCLADTPGDDAFRVACYSEALEPYMARGRELRAEGLESDENFARRHAEIDAGTLAMPPEPTMVYNFGGPADLVDPATGSVDESRGRRVYAVYTPYATAASTGLSETPLGPGAPWIMRPGTPTAHIMIVPPAPEPESGGGD